MAAKTQLGASSTCLIPFQQLIAGGGLSPVPRYHVLVSDHLLTQGTTSVIPGMVEMSLFCFLTFLLCEGTKAPVLYWFLELSWRWKGISINNEVLKQDINSFMAQLSGCPEDFSWTTLLCPTAYVVLGAGECWWHSYLCATVSIWVAWRILLDCPI